MGIWRSGPEQIFGRLAQLVEQPPTNSGHIAQWSERYVHIVEVSRSSRDMPTNIGGGRS